MRNLRGATLNVKRKIHDEIIQSYVERGFSRRGFRKKFIQTFGEDLEDVRVDFVPDGFIIDRDRRRVVLLEVVNTHRLSSDKLKKLAYFWFASDYHEIGVELCVAAEYGETKCDLMDIYYMGLLNGSIGGRKK